MTQTFTLLQNEIIRYVYDETTPSENLIIEELIASDSDCLDFYLDCMNFKDLLNQIQLNPDDSTLDRIFEYSKNYKPVC